VGLILERLQANLRLNPLVVDFALGAATTLLLISIKHTAKTPSLVHIVGRYLSKISFSLYAIHFPLLMAIVAALHGQRYLLSLASCSLLGLIVLGLLCAAHLFWVVFESRTEAVRKAFVRLSAY
jgi:peptidoglycan/LPS O-acetylase OafA/YrhL